MTPGGPVNTPAEKNEQLNNAYLRGIGAYVPERRMSNNEIAEFLDTSDEWIHSKTGIRYRHIAADNQATSDLAAEAGKRALADADLDPEKLDMILVATSSPDYIGLPSTACVVQDLLGAVNASAMDISAVCSGYVYALETARAFVRSGSAANVLVIGAEVYSRIVDWTDRSTCVLFGDGAGASLVSADASTSSIPAGWIRDSVLRSQGKDSQALIRPAGGTRLPIKDIQSADQNQFVKMDGRRVYNFAVRAIGEIIRDLLERNNLELDDIDWVVPHQANARILEAAANRLNYPLERMYSNIEEFANTSAATIPIAMREMADRKLFQSGQKIITVGFGAGLTYGGNLIEFT